jgi:hypothetical protein
MPSEISSLTFAPGWGGTSLDQYRDRFGPIPFQLLPTVPRPIRRVLMGLIDDASTPGSPRGGRRSSRSSSR